MGSLFIKHVKYIGDTWHYESPNFDVGINIIEGKNKSGKTTLINLISYCLGNYVDAFESNTNFHEEIVKDTNNFVELKIMINKEIRTLKRYIKKNYILIIEEELVLPVYRSKENKYIFSDWILDKLNIDVVEIYQGKYQGKINFSDLFRLIHYDQMTSPNLIYKKTKNEGNFVSDSLIIRKAIFEILIGEGVIKYYKALNELTIATMQYKEKKNLKESLEKTMVDVYDLNINTNYVNLLAEIRNSISKKKREQDELLSNTKYDQDVFDNELNHLRKKLIEIELNISSTRTITNDFRAEINNINELLHNRILEINHLNKIIFTNNQLHLFSPDTCPYCFSSVKREKGHCVCGTPIDESSYEHFFYNTDEYIEICEKKKKAITAIEKSLDIVRSELSFEIEKLKKLHADKEECRQRIQNLKKDIEIQTNISGVKRISEDLIELEIRQKNIESKLSVYSNYLKVKADFDKCYKNFDSKNKAYCKEEKKLKDKISSMINKFNTSYNVDFLNCVIGCKKAEINEDYMPIINDGVYINASTEVPKRLIYYITLLKLSLNNNLNFPKLLIIDTAETLGIDPDNLNKIFELLEISTDEEYQVILSTGIGKFPAGFAKYQKVFMPEQHSLLKQRNCSKI